MLTATYSSNDMTVVFTAKEVPDHYGVPGSPRFRSLDPGSVRIKHLEILGLDVHFESLPVDLQNTILELPVEWQHDGRA